MTAYQYYKLAVSVWHKKLFEGRKLASGISQMRYVTVHTSNKIHMYKSYNERKPVNIKKPLTEM